MSRAFLCAALLCAAATARADAPAQLRLSTIAPDGTSFAHELREFAREVEKSTDGGVRVKWVFGGLAGDEPEAAERVQRGQLDGIASAGFLCESLAPSWGALRLLGTYRSRDEVGYVMGQLRSLIGAELKQRGWVSVGEAVLGQVMIFSRHPLRSLADLRNEVLWTADSLNVQEKTLTAVGLQLVRLPITEAGRAFADARTSGFVSIPSGVLAFQWFTQARYMSDLPLDFLPACLLVSERSFERLSIPQQQTLRAAGARLHQRLDAAIARQDEQLVGKLLPQRGVTMVVAPEALRAAFAETVRTAELRLGATLLPEELRNKVEQALADYRAHHGNPGKAP